MNEVIAMKTIERITSQDYEDIYTTYVVDKITDGNICRIITRNEAKKPYGVCSVIEYENIDKTLSSPLLNWHNLIFCSNYCGIPRHKEYMEKAVQHGLKPVATEINQIPKDLPSGCKCISYRDYQDSFYIYLDTTLEDLYDFHEIQDIYAQHDVLNIDWDSIRLFFSKNLSYWGTDSELDLQKGAYRKEDMIITGLLLGYPIESTIALMKMKYKVFKSYPLPKVKDHFKTTNTPFDDGIDIWLKEDNHIFCDGQQENKYF